MDQAGKYCSLLLLTLHGLELSYWFYLIAGGKYKKIISPER